MFSVEEWAAELLLLSDRDGHSTLRERDMVETGRRARIEKSPRCQGWRGCTREFVSPL